MIDTVILIIKQSNFHIDDLRKFHTNKDSIKNARGSFNKWINNPTPQDKADAIYKPRLTLIKRKQERVYNDYLLKIEFSAPKIIFNNNLEEVDENNFEELIKTLESRVFDMGVTITEENLRNADVSAFHPSKNIPLTGGYTSAFAIKELSKIDLNKKFDLNYTSFRNGGQSLQYYANSHSFVIYDKILDLKKPAGRAIDKDRTKQQLDLFQKIGGRKEHLEILRLEVRLSDKRKMNSILNELGYPKNPKFQDILNQTVCQKILNLYWHKMIIDKNVFLFDIHNNPQNVFSNILSHYSDIRLKKAIYLAGLSLLCKDEGIALRGIMGSYGLKTAWSKLQSDIRLLNKVSIDTQKYGFVEDIERSIGAYVPFRFEKLVDISACKEL